MPRCNGCSADDDYDDDDDVNGDHISIYKSNYISLLKEPYFQLKGENAVGGHSS